MPYYYFADYTLMMFIAIIEKTYTCHYAMMPLRLFAAIISDYMPPLLCHDADAITPCRERQPAPC